MIYPKSARFILSLCLTGTSFIFSFVTFARAAGPDISVPDLISFTNLARANAGIASLSPNPLLTAAAQAKANDMLTLGYFAHTTVTDKPPWVFMQAAGYDYYLAGENLARDYSDSRSIINAWLNSPPHRQNLLNPNYSDIGIALVSGNYPNGKPTVIIVQMFGKPATGLSASEGHYAATEALAHPPNYPWAWLLLIPACIGMYFSVRSHPKHASRHSPLSPDLWLH